MNKRAPISAIMTKEVITLNYNDDLTTAEKLFKANNIRHIPIVNGEHVVGMLSYTDLLRISFADAVDEDENTVESVVYNMFTIEQVMTKNLVQVNSNTLIIDVAEILSNNEFHAMAVIDDSELVGMVTSTDLINYLIEQF